MSVEGSDPQSREGKKSQKVSDSHRNDVSPLTQGLRYRAACDTAVRSAISAKTWLLGLVIGMGNVHKYLLPDRERMSMPGIIPTT